MIKRDLRINMRDYNAVFPMQLIFVTFHALHHKHGIICVTKDNPKITVQQIMTSIMLEALQTRLQSDLSFGYNHLKSELKGFMEHCLKLARRSTFWTSNRFQPSRSAIKYQRPALRS